MPEILKNSDVKLGLFITGVIIYLIIGMVSFITAREKRRQNEMDSKQAVSYMRNRCYIGAVILLVLGFPYLFGDMFFK